MFNSSGEMNLLQMEGEALFVSSPPKSTKNINLISNEEDNETEKLVNTNESYYNLGFNEFKMNVYSNMELILNELSPDITKKLNLLSQMINLEIFKVSNSTTETKEDKTSSLIERYNTDNYRENANEKRNLESDIINYPYSYNPSYNIFDISFLGFNINYRHQLEINHYNGLRRNSLILRLGSREYILSQVSLTQNYDGGSDYKKDNPSTEIPIEIGFNIFGFGPKIIITLKCSLLNSISIDVINNRMKTKGYTSHEFTLGANFQNNLIFASYGAKISRQFFKGITYIQVKSISKSSSKSEVILYRSINFYSIDIEIYFSVWIIFWEKKYSQTINLFGGFYLYREDPYYY